MLLTHRVRIYPTNAQKDALWSLSEKCRLFYNFALHERIQNWKRNKKKSKKQRKYLSYTDQQNKLPKLKQKYPNYQWVYSKVLQMTLKKLDANYKSFFALWRNGAEDARPPSYRGKNHFTTLCYNQSGFKLVDDNVCFSHKLPSKPDLTFDISHYPLPARATNVKQVEAYCNTRERWFVSVSYEVSPKKYIDNGKYQAIDLGIRNIVSAVNLDGKFVQFKNRRADKYWKRRIEAVQSKRDHFKRYSRKWRWYHSKLCKMKRKCANQLRDFQHKISKQVVENTRANTIIVGKLEVKKMARKKRSTGNARRNKANKTLNHSLQNTGSMGRFVEFLTYKAKHQGKRIIRIDESYTSQKCAKCGKKKKRSLSERVIICDCGHRLDRDLNSAVNIMAKFVLKKQKKEFEDDGLSHQSSLNEESFLQKWKGFATTHSPKICSPANA
ncbi:MAG: IS200/IS605 family element transposase accessory protein TnpB [Candidatus Lokiarchaeota archaeon]|nr:IS200/IS605 family element transposase accessory protein TnpB [Candidatus Lokiarchaeota archaeon]MBD3341768.1 IS200/IS605 family element transposase accessory protein TnpB [Candidatus Lokiarchaeota archaeon]